MVTQVVFTPGEYPRERTGKAGVVVEPSIAAEDFVQVMESQQYSPLNRLHQAHRQQRQGKGEPDVQRLADAAEAE